MLSPHVWPRLTTSHDGRLVALLVATLSLSPRAAPADCAHYDSGVPPDSSNNSASVFLGEALGQTFLAEGLLIESITVWRVVWEAKYVYGMKIYVVPTDSLGLPDVRNTLLVGPSVFHADGDGVNPTAFEFVFEPPLRLPKLGTYEFAVQSDPCYGIWDILGADGRYDGRDRYADGHLWGHSRSTDEPCHLRTRPASYPAGDLCFKIRYCSDATPAKRSTWGSLKVIYR